MWNTLSELTKLSHLFVRAQQFNSSTTGRSKQGCDARLSRGQVVPPHADSRPPPPPAFQRAYHRCRVDGAKPRRLQSIPYVLICKVTFSSLAPTTLRSSRRFCQSWEVLAEFNHFQSSLGLDPSLSPLWPGHFSPTLTLSIWKPRGFFVFSSFFLFSYDRRNILGIFPDLKKKKRKKVFWNTFIILLISGGSQI